MIDLNFHDVASIEIGSSEHYSNNVEKPFCYRELTIRMHDGNQLVIDLFSTNEPIKVEIK